jgi:hypothetical protein
MAIYGKNIMFSVEKLQNLQIGNIYSYKELCNLLDDKEVKGTSRIAQRKVWDSYFTLEKVEGKRVFKLVHIFDNQQLDNVFRVGEEHIANSAKLILDYFMQYKDTDYFERSEKYPELIETLLFSIDIGETCGYLRSNEVFNYKDVRDILSDKKHRDWLKEKLKTEKERLKESYYEPNPIIDTLDKLQIKDNRVISYFIKTVIQVFADIRNNLLSSLQKKGVIQHHRKVLVRIKNKRPIALLDIEVAQYNLILQEYCKELNRKISTFGFTKRNWTEFNKRLKNELGYSGIYTGYYVAFTEKTVVAELNEIERDVLENENREHFKGKVVAKLESKEQALEIGKDKAPSLFSSNREEARLAVLAMMSDAEVQMALDEIALTQTGVSTEPEPDTTSFMDKLYSDTETAAKTTTDLNKLVDSFL